MSFRSLQRWLQQCWDSKSCLLCMQAIVAIEPICKACAEALPWVERGCLKCGVPMAQMQSVCDECEWTEPLVARTVTAWSYAFPIDALINRFKHEREYPYGRLLAHLLGERLNTEFSAGLNRPDFLLAVPLAEKRERQRGFNQAQMIAAWLGRLTSIGVLNAVVRRVRQTQTQQDLTAKQRRTNMHGAFQVTDTQQVMGLHLAIVDDVVTTGATTTELARCLLNAGAERVDVYCLARTPKPHRKLTGFS